MEKSKESVANTLKKVTSISQVADRFSISRPTLYKYMDFFDRGEFDRIPENILSYFSAMANVGVSADESAVYLLAEEKRRQELERISQSGDDSGMEYRAKAVMDGALRAKERAILSWSEGQCPSICHPTDGGAVVFMKDVPSDAEASVVVSIVVSGESTPIGRYVPEEGMSFVDISNLPIGPDYEYTVEHACGDRTVRSEARKLVLGCRE